MGSSHRTVILFTPLNPQLQYNHFQFHQCYVVPRRRRLFTGPLTTTTQPMSRRRVCGFDPAAGEVFRLSLYSVDHAAAVEIGEMANNNKSGSNI